MLSGVGRARGPPLPFAFYLAWQQQVTKNDREAKSRNRAKYGIMSTPKELQEKIERHRQEIERIARVPTLAAAPTLLASQQSEMFVAASQLAEISTRRIVRLTWD